MRLLLAASLLVLVAGETLEWFQYKVAPLAEECKEETSATEDDIRKVLERQDPDTRASQCLLACVYRRLGGMTRSGLASSDELRDSLLELYRDSAYKQGQVGLIVDRCSPAVEQQPDVCLKARKLFECIRENVY
ncbi:general odorant-binding protein 19d [Bacillus rossius redtenbacheri]|uniref:general odorant-binding protein 19d n=1 Tax=Bacillus rossius redtenbacheri TaxID=93214 RepID=UPI002FDCDA1A